MKTKTVLVIIGVVVLGVGGAIGYLQTREDEGEGLVLAPNVDLPLPLEGRPAQPLEVEMSREEILRIFPVKVSTVETQSRTSVETRESRDSEQDVLEKITSRWVYTDYVNLAGVSIGTFRYNDKPKMEESFEVREGDVHQGVTVFYMDNSKAMARYGSAVIRLPLVDTLEIPASEYPSLAHMEGIPDPTRAYIRYRELWGKRYEQLAKDYVPAPGETMPPKEPLTKQELKERIDRYLEFVGQQVRERKPHPRYEQNEFSLEKLQGTLYQLYQIETAEESPPSGETEPEGDEQPDEDS
jgi:hypothetical protein